MHLISGNASPDLRNCRVSLCSWKRKCNKRLMDEHDSHSEPLPSGAERKNAFSSFTIWPIIFTLYTHANRWNSSFVRRNLCRKLILCLFFAKHVEKEEDGRNQCGQCAQEEAGHKEKNHCGYDGMNKAADKFGSSSFQFFFFYLVAAE